MGRYTNTFNNANLSNVNQSQISPQTKKIDDEESEIISS
jgi:hypothetical protein